MQYAKVVLALPLEGPFDYIIPAELVSRTRAGMRAWVDFRGKKEVGFITAVSEHTDVSRLKPLIGLIDSAPTLSPALLELTRAVARYYCAGHGEAIAASLPEALRRGKAVLPHVPGDTPAGRSEGFRVSVFQDLDGHSRFELYARQVNACRARGCSTIILAADKLSLERLREVIKEKTAREAEVLLRQHPDEITSWEKIRAQETVVVLGLRSAVFAPVNNLGLIIVDDEGDSAYKQDQSPHYHTRTVAEMRCRIEKAHLVLAAGPLSLEGFVLSGPAQENLSVSESLSQRPEVSVIDMKNLPLLDKKKKIILSRTLQDAVAVAVADKKKVLLFLNRKGFATVARCSTCGRTLQCPRCAINLVYYYAANCLRCRYCNHIVVPPKICPLCNAGYIKYSGAGTEKIESELARIFPAARIQRLDAGGVQQPEAADIFISTQAILKHSPLRFDLAAVLGIDNGLNRVDFRAAEKTFELLWGIMNLTDGRLFVQTGVPDHAVFEALKAADPNVFYSAELASRRQLKFPPIRHFIQVRVRGVREEKVHAAAQKLFDLLCARKPDRGTRVVSLAPGDPPKLRGNFYWQILVNTAHVEKANAFLKNALHKFRSSGIIVTVDVDPL